MQFLSRETCQTCNGGMFVMQDDWALFYSIPDNKGLEVPEQIKWFRSHGMYEIPPTTVPCPTCRRKGYIEEWIDIETLKSIIQ